MECLTPSVKRYKNEMADAEAICEAAQRPMIRLVPGKSAKAQASAVVFHTPHLPVRQRSLFISALRGPLTELATSCDRALDTSEAGRNRLRSCV